VNSQSCDGCLTATRHSELESDFCQLFLRRYEEPVLVLIRDLQLFFVRDCHPQEVGFVCGWQCRTTDEIETNRRKSWTGP